MVPIDNPLINSHFEGEYLGIFNFSPNTMLAFNAHPDYDRPWLRYEIENSFYDEGDFDLERF